MIRDVKAKNHIYDMLDSIHESKSDNDNEVIDSINDVLKKYHFKTIKGSKKNSTSDGIVNITLFLDPLKYYINILGGYHTKASDTEKMAESFSNVAKLMKEISEILRDAD